MSIRELHNGLENPYRRKEQENEQKSKHSKGEFHTEGKQAIYKAAGCISHGLDRGLCRGAYFDAQDCLQSHQQRRGCHGDELQ